MLLFLCSPGNLDQVALEWHVLAADQHWFAGTRLLEE
jgi:hypothetical protein